MPRFADELADGAACVVGWQEVEPLALHIHICEKRTPDTAAEGGDQLRHFLIFCAGVSLAGTAPIAAQAPASADAPHHAIHRAADIDWKAGPPSLPAGAQFALLEGDPSKAGYFALQLRMPDGYVIPPHWHPVQERVTVLKGTFRLGQGEAVEREATQALPAGSYFSLAPKMTHYAVMEGETVVQLTSIGPWQITYVNAADDPRN